MNVADVFTDFDKSNLSLGSHSFAAEWHFLSLHQTDQILLVTLSIIFDNPGVRFYFSRFSRRIQIVVLTGNTARGRATQ